MLLALKKLYNQKRCLKQTEEQSKKLGSACDKMNSIYSCRKKKDKFSKYREKEEKTVLHEEKNGNSLGRRKEIPNPPDVMCTERNDILLKSVPSSSL